MNSKNKEKAIILRKQGLSLSKIAEILDASKGSVSYWVKGIALTKTQKLLLDRNAHNLEINERRRLTRLRNEQNKRQKIIDTFSNEIGRIDDKALKMIGIALYWGEGGKTMKGMARVSNSDPVLIMATMRFFREICKVEENRFRGHIHIHSESVVKEAEEYWSDITGIPLCQFHKTYTIKSKSSKNIRKTLRYGTIDVAVCDTKLLLKILGWIDGIKRKIQT